MVFFSISLLPVRVSSGIPYSSCSFLIPALHMLFPFVIVWIRLGLSLASTLFACIIFFFLTIISIGRNPVSASRMAVGVWPNEQPHDSKGRATIRIRQNVLFLLVSHT